jgi:large subunit ribosomal protein L18
MATGPRYKVAFRRRRECRTDYYIRRKLLASQEVRAVVRRSNKNITVQFVEFDMTGDRIIASATTGELVKMGWENSCSNISAAYLIGYLAGKKAIKEDIEYAVLDLGMQNPQYGGVLFAVAKGMIDAGLEVPVSEDVLPEEDRIYGKHINDDLEAAVKALVEKMEAE